MSVRMQLICKQWIEERLNSLNDCREMSPGQGIFLRHVGVRLRPVNGRVRKARGECVTSATLKDPMESPAKFGSLELCKRSNERQVRQILDSGLGRSRGRV